MIAVLFCFGMVILSFANADLEGNPFLFWLNIAVGVWYAWCGAYAGWTRARND